MPGMPQQSTGLAVYLVEYHHAVIALINAVNDESPHRIRLATDDLLHICNRVSDVLCAAGIAEVEA